MYAKPNSGLGGRKQHSQKAQEQETKAKMQALYAALAKSTAAKAPSGQ